MKEADSKEYKPSKMEIVFFKKPHEKGNFP